MSVPARAVTLLVAFLAVVGGVVFVVVHILLAEPPTVDFTAGHAAGQPLSMTIMTDPVNDASPHPDWVSYFVKSPDRQVDSLDDLPVARAHADQRDQL